VTCAFIYLSSFGRVGMRVRGQACVLVFLSSFAPLSPLASSISARIVPYCSCLHIFWGGAVVGWVSGSLTVISFLLSSFFLPLSIAPIFSPRVPHFVTNCDLRASSFALFFGSAVRCGFTGRRLVIHSSFPPFFHRFTALFLRCIYYASLFRCLVTGALVLLFVYSIYSFFGGRIIGDME
jgi:hypothetical protein